jgi:hypothetical protein
VADRVERSDLDGIEPGSTLDRWARDRVKAHAGKHPVCCRYETLAPREPAQLDDDQGAGPRLVVAADEIADRGGVWFGEQYAPE